MSDIGFANLLEALADGVGDRPALVTVDGVVSFAELDERASRFGNLLLCEGVGFGDFVGLFAANSVEWVTAFFGAFKVGAIPVGFNHRFGRYELSSLLEFLPCRVVVTDELRAPVLREVLPVSEGAARVLLVEDWADQAFGELFSVVNDFSAERRFDVRSGADSCLVLTGGTTGVSKGVLWRQEDLFFAAMNSMRGGRPFGSCEDVVAELGEGGLRVGLTAPLAHGGAQWTLGSTFVGGGSVCLFEGRSFDPSEVCRFVELTKVQALPVMGDAMARPLAEFVLERGAEFDLSSLFVIHNGAAPLSESVVDLLKLAFPNCLFYDVYGSSEAGIVGGRSAGDVMASDRVAIVDDAAVRADEGRVVVRGVAPLGYLSAEGLELNEFVELEGERWLVTGDVGRVVDGGFELLGRELSVINSGGEKVFAGEVEQVLLRHELVKDAVVVGVPSERWGSEVCALVVTDGFVSDEELDGFCRQFLAGFKVPKQFGRIPFVPRTVLGKTDYRAASLLM